jgi:Iap family predicted aminopeptidase
LGGQVVHDISDLDGAFQTAHVKESVSGLILVPSDSQHVVKAGVWALQAAHKPAPVPAVA